ncbi:MAG: hypothetical protein ACYDHH_21075 [Solirubrobacteraceae bacterium]
MSEPVRSNSELTDEQCDLSELAARLRRERCAPLARARDRERA